MRRIRFRLLEDLAPSQELVPAEVVATSHQQFNVGQKLAVANRLGFTSTAGQQGLAELWQIAPYPNYEMYALAVPA